MSTIRTIWFFSFLLLAGPLSAQNMIIRARPARMSSVDSLYESALAAYERKDTLTARSGFAQVIVADPGHGDALFNLAVTEYQRGDLAKAADLFQAAVRRFNDRKAAGILKDELHLPVAWADTMFIDDVDMRPMVVTRNGPQPLLVDFALNKALQKPLMASLRKSSLLHRQMPAGKTLYLGFYFGKDGSLNARAEGNYRSELIQKEVTARLSAVPRLIPARHQGREVVVWGYSLPVKF